MITVRARPHMSFCDLAAAALVAVVSAGARLPVAQDTATGVLLARMHLVAGAAFLVTPWRAVTQVSKTHHELDAPFGHRYPIATLARLFARAAWRQPTVGFLLSERRRRGGNLRT
jgi:hypothetical protein